MAGNYPDVPAPRMAYDRDGTVGVTIDSSNNIAQVSQNILNNGNDENDTTYIRNNNGFFQPDMHHVWVFPELRDIIGIWVGSSGNPMPCDTSVNTTTGLDGTWVSRGNITPKGAVRNTGRTDIQVVSWLGVKAVRLQHNGEISFKGMHLYGNIASGQNPDRLRLWHPTSDAELTGAYFDWGDVPRSSSATKTFRVKNNSAGLTANTITLSAQALSDTVPSVSGQHTFALVSDPSYSSTKVITSLAPGVISEVITLRRVTPSDAILSLWWARVIASAASWTA